jgi:hypothetical protein
LSSSSRRFDFKPVHALADFRPFLGEEAAPLRFGEACSRTGGHEQANPALHHDQTFVLEALIGLGDGQRICLFLGGESPDGRQRVAVTIAAGENCVGDRLAEADVNGLSRGWFGASCCHNTAARKFVNFFRRLAGGVHLRTTSSSVGRNRSSGADTGLPMKTNPAIRSPGSQKASVTRGE